MTAETLLFKLDGVRATGTDRWIACCPSHEDGRASLSVRQLPDGRVLVHDFGGCSAGDVLAAVGLELTDLFPPRMEGPFTRGERRPFPAADVLRAVEREALIVAVAASRLGNGGELAEEDRKRLLLASSRLTAAVQETGHAR